MPLLGVSIASVANALKKKAASSWTSYRGSMFAVGWRFVTAWKVYLLSIFYVFGAVWWLFYTVFVVSLGCLFTMGKIPACTSSICGAVNVCIAGSLRGSCVRQFHATPQRNCSVAGRAA